MAIKKALVIYGGSIEELHAGDSLGASGDVTGPSASTDNAIARFDGTTGKIIQDSNITVDDNGSIAGANSLQLDTTPTVASPVVGEIYWDEGNKTPSIQLENDVNLQLGQEIVTLCYNGTGSTIPNGSVVAIVGAQGQRPSIALADADSESTSAQTLGITTEAIANGAEGFVTTFGFIRSLDTSGFTAGVAVYLSQTAGQFTATKPSAPAHLVHLGYVIKSHASAGEVFVTINNGWEFDELHDVLITDLQSGQIPVRDQDLGVWKNITINGTANKVTVTSTKDGITVSLPDTVSANITGNAETVTDGLYTTDLGVTVQAYDPDIPTVAASQAEMEAGTEAALRSMSPLLVAQAIAALGGGGGGGGGINLDIITSSTTWTKPDGVSKFVVALYGGGGGGGGDPYSNSGGTGGNGGIAYAVIPSDSLTSTVAVTIGLGGDRQASGGTSTFGSYLTATGGGPGAASTSMVGTQGSGTVSAGTRLYAGNITGFAPAQVVATRVGMPFGISGIEKQSIRARGTGSGRTPFALTNDWWGGAGGQGDSGTGNNPAGGVDGLCVIFY